MLRYWMPDQVRHDHLNLSTFLNCDTVSKAGVQMPKIAGFPFDVAQGGESFDFALDREPVERPVEPPPSRE
jgi:hypothetical protein